MAEEKVQAGSQPQSTAPQASGTQPLAALPPQVQQELNEIVSGLLTKAHEITFELATSDCPHVNTCPIAQKAKDIAKLVKRLISLQRMMPR